MEKFSLEEWLQDRNRKICTRDGREVTIEKTDIHIHGMSHMILGKYGDIYEIWHSNGRINYTGSDCNLDLFFPDEEEQNVWSEEDEEKIMWLVRLISTAGFRELDNDKMPCSRNELLDWLKSLKPRWKPTEKQMEALTIAVHDSHEHHYYKNLYSLYNDLKSL